MRKRSIAVVSIIALLAASPANAIIPVEDHVSIGVQISSWVKQAGQMATQISNLANMVNLTTLMTTAVGDGLGGGMAALLGEGRIAGAKAMQAYGSVMRVPTTIDNELALLSPAGFENLTILQAVARAEQIRKMTQGTAAANTKASAERTQQNMRRDQMQMNANAAKWEAVGTLGGLQALGQQAELTNEFGRLSYETLEGIGNSIDMQIQKQAAGEEMVIQMARDDETALRDRVGRGAGRPSSDLAKW